MGATDRGEGESVGFGGYERYIRQHLAGVVPPYGVAPTATPAPVPAPVAGQHQVYVPRTTAREPYPETVPLGGLFGGGEQDVATTPPDAAFAALLNLIRAGWGDRRWQQPGTTIYEDGSYTTAPPHQQPPVVALRGGPQ